MMDIVTLFKHGQLPPVSVMIKCKTSGNELAQQPVTIPGSGQQQQPHIGFGCVPGGQVGPAPNGPIPSFRLALDDTDIRVLNFIFNYL